jgi:hypothetical protein
MPSGWHPGTTVLGAAFLEIDVGGHECNLHSSDAEERCQQTVWGVVTQGRGVHPRWGRQRVTKYRVRAGVVRIVSTVPQTSWHIVGVFAGNTHFDLAHPENKAYSYFAAPVR